MKRYMWVALVLLGLGLGTSMAAIPTSWHKIVEKKGVKFDCDTPDSGGSGTFFE